MKLITSSISVLLLSLAASAAPIQFSSIGTFAATGTNQWPSKKIVFTGTAFTVPTAGSADVVLGTIALSPIVAGSIAKYGVTPDFSIAMSILGDDENTSTPFQFKWDMQGSIFDMYGLRGNYDISAQNSTAVTSVTYATEYGTGSFKIKLRDTRPGNPWNLGAYPGFASISPNSPTGTLGASIFDATFALTPIPVTPTPEPATYLTLGMSLLGLSLIRRRRTSR